MTYLTIKPIVDTNRQLARSALPDAPVVADRSKPRHLRNASAQLLRLAARGQLRLAERMAPRQDCAPQPFW